MTKKTIKTNKKNISKSSNKKIIQVSICVAIIAIISVFIFISKKNGLNNDLNDDELPLYRPDGYVQQEKEEIIIVTDEIIGEKELFKNKM